MRHHTQSEEREVPDAHPARPRLAAGPPPALAFSMGLRHLPRSATQARRGWFVEPVEFPVVEVTKSGGTTFQRLSS